MANIETLVKNQNFVTKIQILDAKANLSHNKKILVKNLTFLPSSKFLPNIEILVKNQKKKIKTQNVGQHRTFAQKLKFCVKNPVRNCQPSLESDIFYQNRETIYYWKGS